MNEPLHNWDDLELRVKAGDEQALALLFDQWQPRLLRIVKARLDPRLSARVDPQDVLQDAYLDLVQRLPRFADPAKTMSPFVWIRLVVKERLIRLYRRHFVAEARDARRERNRQKAGDHSESIILVNCLLDKVSSVSGRMMRQEMTEAVLQKIEAMDEADREVITMRVFEQLSNSEAAEALGLSANGASSRFVRAMTRLKQALASIPDFREQLGHIFQS